MEIKTSTMKNIMKYYIGFILGIASGVLLSYYSPTEHTTNDIIFIVLYALFGALMFRIAAIHAFDNECDE